MDSDDRKFAMIDDSKTETIRHHMRVRRPFKYYVIM